ncbi:MAG: type 4a pilus biogenesis protein PilO, partial [Magnetococcales bacterium]|nr:type 4a pilus biogenesis protein PilO [Magnetococcales bacterium]
MELGFDPGLLLRFKPIQKIGIAFAIILAIAGIYWQFFFKDQQTVMDSLDTEIAQQKENINTKQNMLKQLPKLRKELAELKILEAEAAQKLPSQKDIPNLLTD